MTEASSFADRAMDAAFAIYSDYGFPADRDILRTMLALAWMQGNQSGSDETAKLLRDELAKVTS